MHKLAEYSVRFKNLKEDSSIDQESSQETSDESGKFSRKFILISEFYCGNFESSIDLFMEIFCSRDFYFIGRSYFGINGLFGVLFDEP